MGGGQCQDRRYRRILYRRYPSNSLWLNRIEAQFTALRCFALDGTEYATLKEQASVIGQYITWRDNHAYDERLRQIVDGQT